VESDESCKYEVARREISETEITVPALNEVEAFGYHNDYIAVYYLAEEKSCWECSNEKIWGCIRSFFNDLQYERFHQEGTSCLKCRWYTVSSNGRICILLIYLYGHSYFHEMVH